MSKLIVCCKKCGVQFLKHKSDVKRTNNHFCTNKCSREFIKETISPTLKQSKIQAYNINPAKCARCDLKLDYAKRKNKFCSTRCSAFESQKFGGHKKWDLESRKKLSDLAKKQVRIKNHKSILCPNCGIAFNKHQKSKQIYCSQNCRYAYVKVNGLLKGKVGGLREKGGRGKQGWYKGYYCNSSWELAWIIYNLDHDIKFKRNTVGFPYTFNGKNYNYFPDFFNKDTNEYFEIKGYLDARNKAKISSFPFKLNVIDKSKITTYIEYVTKKYGSNYTDLYEK